MRAARSRDCQTAGIGGRLSAGVNAQFTDTHVTPFRSESSRFFENLFEKETSTSLLDGPYACDLGPEKGRLDRLHALCKGDPSDQNLNMLIVEVEHYARAAARQKAEQVAAKLKQMKLADAAAIVAAGIEETLYYYAFPREHWRSLRTNNPLERLLREVRRRTRAVGAFPDGKSALMLAAARLRHVAGTNWGMRRYLDMNRLSEASEAA
jgi:Transposase, Mutator family